MPQRLPITKTYKLFIDGKFPRSESGRTLVVQSAAGQTLAHVAHASRKDLRDAVTAARAGLAKWREATAYNRGQVLYRVAEMLETKRDELREAIDATSPKKPKRDAIDADADVSNAIDLFVHYAGWADKHTQVLGSHNPVAGPYYAFTMPEPVGVVALLPASTPPMLATAAQLAPAMCAANASVLLSGDAPASRLITAILGEVIATSDVPPGVVNLLTCERAELVPIVASHRDVDGVLATGVSPEHAATLRAGAAENLKRVQITEALADPAKTSLRTLECLVEMKTVWHPSAV